ncbi:hypothetical protein MXAN_6738 [Myxococcus xanthus DK 1622]|uniref:Uncharacterized protein n=1 Tax=Myxococcus xanthus (strain DK1622) TaxID=246197 RepID=Q1CXL8_MYXXD|nr:hypothetical protein MXAN_6738 [Myxococcus xanthus DK 1622]
MASGTTSPRLNSHIITLKARLQRMAQVHEQPSGQRSHP